MEGPFRLLLLAGLLAAVLPAAAATFGPQPGAPCEPTILATQVSLYCAPDMPTAQCCEPVVAAVDLGGGVPCLCRVAAEPQLVMAGLNATHLLTLYTSCGGLRPGGAHLAAACEGPASPAAVVFAPPPSPVPRRKQPAHEAPPPPPSTERPSPPPQQHALAATATVGLEPGAPCEPTLLATQVSLFCAPDMPTAQCCEPVVAAVDLGGGVPCLCRVAAQPQLVMAGLNASHLLTLYTSCGGLLPGGAHLAAACEDEAAPLPPSSEKRSLPPQQHDGSGHSKDVPAYAATSTLAPAGTLHRPYRRFSRPRVQHTALLPCDVDTIASAISRSCATTVKPISRDCCESATASAASIKCLCMVSDRTRGLEDFYSAYAIVNITEECGLTRDHVGYADVSVCYGNTIPDLPPVHFGGEHLRSRDRALLIVIDAFGVLHALVCVILLIKKVIEKIAEARQG